MACSADFAVSWGAARAGLAVAKVEFGQAVCVDDVVAAGGK